MRYGGGNVDRISMPFRAVSHRLSLTIFIILSFALLLFSRAEAQVFDEARDKVAEWSAPIMEFISTPLAVMREWVGDIEDYFSVYEENRRLKEENARLLAWKAAALSMEQTAARYEALLNVQLEPGIGYVTGRVISDSGGPFVKTYIVNAGRDDGVLPGQAVVDAEGLVGRLVGVGPEAARVLRIVDLNSRIPVMVEPLSVRAILKGENDADPSLLHLPEDVTLNDGDRVVTSGHGGLFPPGLPVGTVVVTGPDSYRVRPFTHDSRIDFVRILQFEFPSRIDPVEPATDEDGEADPEADGEDQSTVGLLGPDAPDETE